MSLVVTSRNSHLVLIQPLTSWWGGMETQDRNAERGEGWGVLQDNVAQVSPQCSTISGKESHKHHWSGDRSVPDSLETLTQGEGLSLHTWKVEDNIVIMKVKSCVT